VKELAENFSCINHEEGKRNVRKRYEELINIEFRSEAIRLVTTYNKFKVFMNQDKVMEKVKDLYVLIMKCDRIWTKHAYE